MWGEWPRALIRLIYRSLSMMTLLLWTNWSISYHSHHHNWPLHWRYMYGGLQRFIKSEIFTKLLRFTHVFSMRSTGQAQYDLVHSCGNGTRQTIEATADARRYDNRLPRLPCPRYCRILLSGQCNGKKFAHYWFSSPLPIETLTLWFSLLN